MFIKRIYKFLSLYNLNSTGTKAGLYEITSHFISIIIPGVEKMELFEFESCIEGIVSQCRSVLDRQSQAWHTSKPWRERRERTCFCPLLLSPFKF